ncbi:RCC1 domain-containing protein [Sandaracinus amylolyticus]|uniref:RCC1 domain-containing protein n=1 Tax=Sandaracinus amylolyticus TaxID=927083 RepID=UPI001F1BBEA9|nr:hypothetical protein [Sandaracinus amylolyticus]
MVRLVLVALCVCLCAACGSPLQCGELEYDADEHQCVCPAGRHAIDGACVALVGDGGIVGDAGDGSAPTDASSAQELGDTGVDGSVSLCPEGWADCDSSDDNGCETQLDTLAHCGGCGDACGWACEHGVCNDAIAIAAGGLHSCALREAGDVVCWGDNEYGQLGDGTTLDSLVPVRVAGLQNAVAISSSRGSHTCALLESGQVLCWGANNSGQLGNGETSTAQPTPVPVLSPGAAFVGVSAGSNSTCAWRSSGEALCWGYNGSGQIGDGTEERRVVPTPVEGIDDAIAMRVGGGHACAIRSGRTLECWGSNAHGQLGDGTDGAGVPDRADSASPTAVANLGPSVYSIGAGLWNTCAVLAAGGLRCWGRNSEGQVGDGTTTLRNAPTTVRGLESGVLGVDGGTFHACALISTGAVECWGRNNEGELGDGTSVDRSAPGPVALRGAAIALATGVAHSCVVTAEGAVECWGRNLAGNLGDGTTLSRTTPVAVLPPAVSSE